MAITVSVKRTFQNNFVKLKKISIVGKTFKGLMEIQTHIMTTKFILVF